MKRWAVETIVIKGAKRRSPFFENGAVLCHGGLALLSARRRGAPASEPEPIDWEYYRKGIGSRLVDMYKQAYDDLWVTEEREGKGREKIGDVHVRMTRSKVKVKIPKYVDNVTPQYKPKFDALLVELKEAEESSLKESERLEKEIAEVQELKQKKLSTMTADEYFEKHPELKKKFDDEIRNDYWGY
ncbi:UNVERIFIED_CONTAM: ATP synthase subunit d, mitochondrial [Sesamum calycinum]|uniref:ATP synthase subunit d, mitochondrial n=1 Tax=Sesamum calycinum TaxID=2727403 RepID=A0AAW2SD79_9LAMI